MTLAGRAFVVLAALAVACLALPFVIDAVVRIAPIVIVLWLIGAILRAMVRRLFFD